jgi:hypothetical protein
VNLRAAIEAELPFLRAEAEGLMVDAGTAWRPTGGTTYDDESQTEVPVLTGLFDSRCKIQTGGLQARDEEVGERTSAVVSLELHLPAATAPLAAGDEFEVATPHALSTVPAGTVYRVVAPVEGSLKTARRYQVERRSS